MYVIIYFNIGNNISFFILYILFYYLIMPLGLDNFIRKAFAQWSRLAKLCAHAFFCSTDGTATIIVQRSGSAGREAVGPVSEVQAERRRGRGFPPRSTAHPTALRFGGG